MKSGRDYASHLRLSDDDSNEESSTLLSPQLKEKSGRGLWSCLPLMAITFTSILLLAALALAVQNAIMLSRLELYSSQLVDETDRKYGYGSPVPSGGFSGEENFSTMSASAPKFTGNSGIRPVARFPTSIDIIDDREADKVVVMDQNVRVSGPHVSNLSFPQTVLAFIFSSDIHSYSIHRRSSSRQSSRCATPIVYRQRHVPSLHGTQQ